jgi:Na+/H+ antiporter NhaC
LLLKHLSMLTNSHILRRAGPVQAEFVYSVASNGWWQAALIVITAAFFAVLLTTQFGRGAKLEKGAEIALSRARELLQEADKENRNVRPLPLSLAKSDV